MLKRLIIIVAAIAVFAAGLVAYAVFRPPEQASGPIEAIPLNTSTPVQTAGDPTVPSASTEVPPSPTANDAQPTNTAESETADAPILFEIVPEESEARFLINEVLRGNPKTVVGSTNQVAGQIAINPSDPTASQVGVIQVNARTLTTDNDFRNRAIKNAILRTNEFEFVRFVPTKITGLPTAGALGETYTFQVTGDLTITDVTREVTFDVTVTAKDRTRIEGSATTMILYRDFGLGIPDSPSVDTVADEVRLELSFIAQATS